MTALNTIATRRYAAFARYCEDETRRVEEALHESKRLDDLFTTISELVEFFIETYEEFRQVEAEADRCWSAHPELFNPVLHARMVEVETQWGVAFERINVGLKSVSHREGVEARRFERFRALYGEYIACRRMDEGSLPTHLRELSEQAVEDYRANRGEEMFR